MTYNQHVSKLQMLLFWFLMYLRSHTTPAASHTQHGRLPGTGHVWWNAWESCAMWGKNGKNNGSFLNLRVLSFSTESTESTEHWFFDLCFNTFSPRHSQLQSLAGFAKVPFNEIPRWLITETIGTGLSFSGVWFRQWPPRTTSKKMNMSEVHNLPKTCWSCLWRSANMWWRHVVLKKCLECDFDLIKLETQL